MIDALFSLSLWKIISKKNDKLEQKQYWRRTNNFLMILIVRISYQGLFWIICPWQPVKWDRRPSVWTVWALICIALELKHIITWIASGHRAPFQWYASLPCLKCFSREAYDTDKNFLSKPSKWPWICKMFWLK